MTEETLFAAALELATESERDEYLRQQCAGEPELLSQVSELLRAHHQASPLLDRATAGAQFDVDTDRVGGLQVRCPHCNSPQQIRPDAELETIRCDSCSSEYSLINSDAAAGLSQISHFRLVERVGIGGFGAVWKAIDTKLGRTVAIKIPRRGRFDQDQEKAFLREAQSAAQLNHPGIVPVHEVGRDGDTLFIVSEFVTGMTLAAWLENQQPTTREAARLTKKIADALHHAHERGVVHCDLKPGNIMLDQDQQPRLMDFGLARSEVSDVTVTVDGAILGTPAYMPPEQARGERSQTDRRSDVYSLGVILFQLLTGELPFRGNLRIMLQQVLHEEPPSPRSLNSLVSRDLETITLKCLQKDPQRRYATAEDVGQELQRVLDGQSIVARPIGRTVRAARWVARHRSVSALVAAVAMLLIVGGPTIVWLRQSARLVEAENRHLAEIRDVVRRSQYQDKIVAAAKSLRRRDGVRTRRVLADTESETKFRGWEWSHLRCRADNWAERYENVIDYSQSKIIRTTDEQKRAVAVYDRTIGRDVFSHTFPEPVQSVVVNPDGTQFAVKQGLRAEVWDIASGAMIAQLQDVDIARLYIWPGEHIVVHEVAEPDGCTLWYPRTGQRFRIDYRGRSHGAAFSSKLVACTSNYNDESRGTGGLVEVWDAENRKHIGEIYTSRGIQHAAQLSDSRPHLGFLEGDREVQFWEIMAGKLEKVNEFPIDQSAEWPGMLRSSNRFAATVRRSVLAWDTATMKELGPFDKIATNRIVQPTFNPSGDTVAARWDSVYVWDTATGKHTHTLEGAVSSATNPRFLSDHEFATKDQNGTLWIWDLTDPTAVVVLGDLSSRVLDLDYSSSGDRIVATNDQGRVCVWNTDSGELLAQPQSEYRPKPTTRKSESGNNPIARKIQEAGSLFNKYVDDFADQVGWHAKNGWAVQFANHDDWVITRSYHAVNIWPAAGGPRIAWRPSSGRYRDGRTAKKIEVDTNAGVMLIGSPDPVGTVTIEQIDIESGELLDSWLPHGESYDSIVDLKLSPDGALVATCAAMDGFRLSVWDRKSHRRVGHMTGHEDFIYAVDFHPDGNRLGTASNDKTARVWDLAQGASLATLEHPTDVWALAFHPDGQRMATADAAGTIRLWDLVNYKLVFEWKEHKGGVTRLQFSPDGRQLASASSDGTVRLWNSVSNFDRRAAAQSD